MLESYIRTGDGTDYVEVDCVREALGIKEDESIFRAIEKLKAERDELKAKCDKLKTRINAAYGYSEYTGDKAPAFLCNVISYSWSFGAIDTPFPNNSIRVELKLTPTANYKGTFDLEDLKKYIQAYGREKKLGIVESVDYQNAKAARAELAYLYKTVLGKEKLDTNLSPHEVMKAIHDEYKRVKDSQLAFSQCLRSVYMHVYEGTGYKTSDIYAAPDKLADGIITRYDSAKKLSDFEVFCKLINGCIDELCDKHNVVQPARSKTTRERLEYIFSALTDYRNMADSNFNKAVEFRKEKQAAEDSRREFVRELSCSLGFGDPVVNQDNIDQKEKDILERIEGLKAGVWPCENSSTFAEYLKKEFPELCKEYNVYPLTEGGSVRDWIKYIFDVLVQYRECSDKVFNKAEGFRKEKRAAEDSLNELRAKIREIYRSVVGDEWDEHLSYTSALNDINEEYKRVVHNFEERTADWRNMSLQEFRDNVCEIFDIQSSTAYKRIIKELRDIAERYDELTRLRSGIFSELSLAPESCDGNILGRIHMMQDCHDKLDRLRSNICTALCLGCESSDEDILNAIAEDRKESNKLTVFRNDVAKAIGLPYIDINSDIVNRVMEIKEGNDMLIEFRDSVAKAMGMDYPTTNQFIVSRVADIYKERGEAHDLAMELDRKCIDLTAKNSDLESKFQFQSGLRQQWHARYESEHERANGVQKALDREKEKCRVKDISLETAKKQYEKVCGNLETAECALNGMKSKIRSLQDEKTKVISALGQDIWDDCLK